MRKRTVRYGLKLILIGVLSVMAVTFFHAELSLLFMLGGPAEARLTFLGFFLGGLSAGCGILVAATGLLQSGTDERAVRLAPVIMLLIISILLFFFLAYSSFFTPSPPTLRPGESITI